MTIIIDGKKVAQKLTDEVAENTKVAFEKYNKKPGLAVVLVGENPASQVYVNKKVKTTEATGMYSRKITANDNISQQELLNIVEELNQDDSIHGILVQLPLPKHIDSNKIIEKINPLKDVDGFHTNNVGKLYLGQTNNLLIPCTPLGSIKLMQYYNLEINGKNALIIGRSNIVGKPMAHLLLQHNATVTIAHSRTQDIQKICQNADIVIAAVGIAHYVKAEWIKPGAVIIDVGINAIEDPQTKKRKIVGDVDFEACKEKTSAITPVPGGVGPMTIACLLQNTLQAFYNQN